MWGNQKPESFVEDSRGEKSSRPESENRQILSGAEWTVRLQPRRALTGQQLLSSNSKMSTKSPSTDLFFEHFT